MKTAEYRHISIIGTSIGSRDFPTKGERWGLAWHSDKGFDRLFEMHDFRYYRHLKRDYKPSEKGLSLPPETGHELLPLVEQALAAKAAG